MDYLDRVFVEVRALRPGRYPVDTLKEPERFIAAVKELMDGEWLRDLYFTSDYRILVIQQPFNGNPKTTIRNHLRRNWYDNKTMDEEDETNGLPDRGV